MDYLAGARMAIDNSKSLLDGAADASNRNNFGLGCSLAVLSGEEAIKAIFCIQKHFFPEVENNSFTKIFQDHKLKHEQIKLAMAYIGEMLQMTKRLYPDYKLMVDQGLDKTGKLLSADVVEHCHLVLAFMKTISGQPRQFTRSQVKNWWDKANRLKNKGLYLSMTSNSWHEPQSISRAEFEEALGYTKSLRDLTMFMLSLFVAIEYLPINYSHEEGQS